MKVLSCNYSQNGLRQIVLSVTTMHVVNTRSNRNNIKKIHIPFSKNWKLLNGNGYSIHYPYNWCVDNSLSMGLSFVIYSQPPSNSNRFRENVNLMIQNLAGQNMNMDKFVQKSQDQIKTMLQNENIIESERIRVNGKEYHKIHYKGNSRGFDLEFLQYYRIQNDKAYILTLTCETNQFGKLVKTAERMMASFTVQELQ
jgi:hypothetical protein